jgi:hypothetical protein
MKIILGIVLLLLSVAVAAAQDDRCDQAESRKEVQRLTETGAIVSMEAFPPYVTVVVDERRWSRSTFEAKKAMAQQIDCATAGPGNVMLRRVMFRSNKDNQVLGLYSGNVLTGQ